MGSSLHGGRWNPKGVAVVYAAASASLATLEILVQYSVLPRDFVLTEIHIPSKHFRKHPSHKNLGTTGFRKAIQRC